MHYEISLKFLAGIKFSDSLLLLLYIKIVLYNPERGQWKTSYQLWIPNAESPRSYVEIVMETLRFFKKNIKKKNKPVDLMPAMTIFLNGLQPRTMGPASSTPSPSFLLSSWPLSTHRLLFISEIEPFSYLCLSSSYPCP